MRRPLLEQLLREVAQLGGGRTLVVIASQAVHAAADDVPAEVVMSRECDLLHDEDDPLAADYELVAALRGRGVVDDDVLRARHGSIADADLCAVLTARRQIVVESGGR